MSSTSKLVVTEDLPVAELRDHDFEECIYWLLDAMGAHNLAWRKGSAGKKGTADGGRDLEAHFKFPQPNAQILEEYWWLDAKGRTSTLERKVVQEIVLNAQAEPDLTVFVVATNTTFTNPTRDWVKTFQEKHPTPRIELWDGDDIKRLLSKYPQVVARLFGKALSTQGKLEVLTSRFLETAHYSDGDMLEAIWSERHELEWTSFSMLAVVACEIANGNLGKHPWFEEIGHEDILSVLNIGFANTFYIINRLSNRGANQEHVIKTLAYYLIACAVRFKTDFLCEVIGSSFVTNDGKEFPDTLKWYALEPIIGTALDDLLKTCSDDCNKVVSIRPSEFDVHSLEFWSQFTAPKILAKKDDEPRYVTLQKTDIPCPIGMECIDGSCPLSVEAKEYSEAWLKDSIALIGKVSRTRINQFEEKNKMQEKLSSHKAKK